MPAYPHRGWRTPPPRHKHQPEQGTRVLKVVPPGPIPADVHSIWCSVVRPFHSILPFRPFHSIFHFILGHWLPIPLNLFLLLVHGPAGGLAAGHWAARRRVRQDEPVTGEIRWRGRQRERSVSAKYAKASLTARTRVCRLHSPVRVAMGFTRLQPRTSVCCWLRHWRCLSQRLGTIT